ncbi:hypothetical protein [Ruegeria sp.]|uniref:hypothetical protein n=1 Tax=Ruegeria sp. TaxID=1879320 RepID=UPI003B00EBF0
MSIFDVAEPVQKSHVFAWASHHCLANSALKEIATVFPTTFCSSLIRRYLGVCWLDRGCSEKYPSRLVLYKFDRSSGSSQLGRILIFASVASADVREVICMLTDRGFDVQVCENFGCLALSAAGSAVGNESRLVVDDFDMVFVDLALSGMTHDLDDSVGLLCRFRESNPKVKVIVFSDEFKSDDLGVDRLAATDVSIRLPVDADRLAQGVVQAGINNVGWRNRHQALWADGTE